MGIDSATILPMTATIAVFLCLSRVARSMLEADQSAYMDAIVAVGALGCCAQFCGALAGRLFACGCLGILVDIATEARPATRLAGLAATGLLWGLMGERVWFVGMPGGAFMYLAPAVAVMGTAAWMTVFAMMFSSADEQAGLGGAVFLSSAVLIVAGTVFSGGQDIGGVLGMGIASVLVAVAFFDRLAGRRRMGSALSTGAGLLLAGLAVTGMAKGIVFLSVLAVASCTVAAPMAGTVLALLPGAGERPLYESLRGAFGMAAPWALAGLGAVLGLFAMTSPVLGGCVALVVLASGGIALFRRGLGG